MQLLFNFLSFFVFEIQISSTLASVATSQQKDDLAIFLQHIGRQIRNINSRMGQLVLQNEIQQIVFRAVLEVNDEKFCYVS